MSWVSPPVFVSGTTLTAAQANILSSNLLETAPAKATQAGSIFVGTGANALAERTISQDEDLSAITSASTTYTNLPGDPILTNVTTGTQALVGVTARAHNSGAGNDTLMAFAVTGSTTKASQDQDALNVVGDGSNDRTRATVLSFVPGLTAGANTFRAQYRVSAGTGTWDDKRILVIGL